MGIHIACSAAELGRVGELAELPELLLDADLIYLELLSEPGRRSRLAVCLGKHRHLFPGLGHFSDGPEDLPESRDVDFLQGLLEHQWLGGVVDVLGSKAEMHELGPFLQTHLLEPALDEILHSLDVVVGDRLDFLDLHCLLRCQILVNQAHLRKFIPVDVRQLRERNFA